MRSIICKKFIINPSSVDFGPLSSLAFAYSILPQLLSFCFPVQDNFSVSRHIPTFKRLWNCVESRLHGHRSYENRAWVHSGRSVHRIKVWYKGKEHRPASWVCRGAQLYISCLRLIIKWNESWFNPWQWLTVAGVRIGEFIAICEHPCTNRKHKSLDQVTT